MSFLGTTCFRVDTDTHSGPLRTSATDRSLSPDRTTTTRQSLMKRRLLLGCVGGPGPGPGRPYCHYCPLSSGGEGPAPAAAAARTNGLCWTGKEETFLWSSG
ncbi:uncharacterized protein V6R79_009725 [Siganus canaliculatus]